MADMNSNLNISTNSGFQVQSGSQNIKVTGKNIQKALEHIAAPVFDFFTKTTPEEATKVVDYEKAIANAELQSATILGILNESDPKAKRKFDVVI